MPETQQIDQRARVEDDPQERSLAEPEHDGSENQKDDCRSEPQFRLRWLSLSIPEQCLIPAQTIPHEISRWRRDWFSLIEQRRTPTRPMVAIPTHNLITIWSDTQRVA
jgi:hypothetical protein